jgi:mannosyltransferase
MNWLFAHNDRQSSLPLVLLLPLLLVSFGLRVYRLGDKSVWWDEGLAAWAARQPLADIARWTSADVHPPLYFWMLHFWRLGSGDSEFSLRLLSAAIGVLTVVAAYLLGREVAGRRTGLLAALLVGLSRFDVWWSQEMRMYVLAALLATLSLWFAMRFWDRGRLVDGGLYVLFTVAGLYTLYLLALVLVVANLAWLWVWWRSRERWRAFVRWGAAQALSIALFVPWLAYALGRIPTWSSASPVQPAVFLRIYWTVLAIGNPVNVERYAWLTVPLLVLFLAGLGVLLWTGQREQRTARNAGLLLLGVLLPAGVVYLVSLPRKTLFYSPQLAPRYLIIFASAFYVLLAWGVTRIGERWRWPRGALPAAWVVGAAWAAGTACYGLWSYYPGRVLADDYKSLALTLRACQRPGDAVVLYTDQDWPVFAYHYAGPWFKIPHALQVTPEAAAAYLSPVWEEHDGVWLVITPYAGVNDPQGNVPAWLAERAVSGTEHRFDDKILRFYARTSERAAVAGALAPGAGPLYPLQADLGGGVRLAGYDQPLHEYSSGDAVHLFLYWETGLSGEGPADVEVRMVHGARGPPGAPDEERTWQRVVAALPARTADGSASRQQVDLVIPPDAPEGAYTIAVRLLPVGQALDLGRFSLRSEKRAALTPADVTIAHPLDVTWGDNVRLLGYDLEAQAVAPGGTVALTLYWQARGQVEQRYKVFTHLLGQAFNAERDSFIWGQQDNEPVSGTRPTPTWRAGEVIVDSYAILLDPRAPEGEYTIEIGLYDPATLARLPVLGDQGQIVADHVVLGQVTVVSSGRGP